MIAYLGARGPGPVWARDVTVAVLYLVVGLLLMWAVPEIQVHWGTGPPAAAGPPLPPILVLAVACLGSTVRQSVPLAGLALATVALLAGPLLVGTTDLGTLLVFGDLLYCSVLYTGRRTGYTTATVCGLAVVAVAVTMLLTVGGRFALYTLLNLLLLVAVPVLWGLEVRRHRDLADAERDRAEQAGRMAELDREAAVAAERARMARDLHDVVAGQLSAIALQTEAVLHHADPDRELLYRVLGSVREGSVSALAEMRTMIGLLRAEPGAEPRTAPPRLDQLGPLLDTAREHGLQVELDDGRPDGPRPAAAVELVAYRVVQEGLTNAVKHAPGSSVRLTLGHDRDALVVRLDNTLTEQRPAPPETSGGTGLPGLAERARAVGGRFEAGPVDGGWRVLTRLPLVAGTPVGHDTSGDKASLG